MKKLSKTLVDKIVDNTWIGEYKVIAIQAIRGQLELTIEKP